MVALLWGGTARADLQRIRAYIAEFDPDAAGRRHSHGWTGRAPSRYLMRALVQRADGASVSIHGEVTGSFDGPGLVVFVGVTHTDTPELAARLAAKVWGARRPTRWCLPSSS